MSKKKIKNTINILIPFVLGGGILYWMYRGFDLDTIKETFVHEMNWWWMLFSLIFGVTAQLFRAFRWKQSLDPIGEKASLWDCIHGVFISYASSLVIPRSGEIVRCGVLAKYDGVSFPKAVGTVVAERAVDSLLLLLICFIVAVSQLTVFDLFFQKTGTNLSDMLRGFTATGYLVTALCLVITGIFCFYAFKKLTIFAKVRQVVSGIKEGLFSLHGVENKPLLLFYSVMIWVSYFLHYWITFLCFDFTANLGFTVAIVSFIIGSISVIVPTPNGAGPWHFAVKTILILYGVSDANAITFVLIVHTVQTALIPLLGIFSSVCLAFKKKVEPTL